ncbi:MAG: GNAT family N-acetyltransferase [Ferruginibacter sp.]
MGLKQIDHGTKEYKQMVSLRHQMLRQPLGLTFSQEELEKEKDNILIAAFDDDDMLGCCMLTKVNSNTMQIRQMAVPNNLQGKGIGASLISFMETIARDKGCKCLVMHARDTAVSFYEKFGYKAKGEPFMEVGIPHHVMEKRL